MYHRTHSRHDVFKLIYPYFVHVKLLTQLRLHPLENIYMLLPQDETWMSQFAIREQIKAPSGA